MTAFTQIASWLDQHNINLITVTATLALLVGASVVIVLVNRVLRSWLRLLEARITLPYETVLVVNRIVSALLWLITVLILLDIWGVGIQGIWTLLVSAAAVIGVGFLATWAMVSNVTASVFITVWRPFYLGDTVEVLPEAMKGRVIDRNLMYTTLHEESGSVVHVPNNMFFQKMFRVVDGGQRFMYGSAPAAREAPRKPAD